ncbi:hypothetical protein HYPBUDRAFT_179275 [Hyphopichia burtonii NRRL Y-1933]|uniref:Transcription activator GCR1-like domain-containing protein n=1 Tax=Hyphopichia burtonii NRRL Y-1933 TaxID=984485 RepID=A0A1E4RSB9_9ASCO|nr:hypothetical protein HYPBUDRAFT_179275 [Hyphopichia burtonii NRRL Y-1933]ODV70153.1 hypothetical protein HYPBUDRAFT_179275 [Hyphopichia burtonii NRRL Y-1933]
MDMVDITTTFLESQKTPLDVVDSLIPRIIDINQKTYKFIALSQSSILSNFKQLSDLGKKIEGLKVETRDIRLESKNSSESHDKEIPEVKKVVEDINQKLGQLLANSCPSNSGGALAVVPPTFTFVDESQPGDVESSGQSGGPSNFTFVQPGGKKRSKTSLSTYIKKTRVDLAPSSVCYFSMYQSTVPELLEQWYHTVGDVLSIEEIDRKYRNAWRKDVRTRQNYHRRHKIIRWLNSF